MSVRAVIVGAGLMGRWHCDAIARAGGRVVGVVDSDSDTTRSFARRFDAEAHRDLTAAFESEPDVVHVCTPLATHRPVAEQALARGLSVVVEKPLAGSPEDTEELFALARERGAVLCPVHQLVFQRWLSRVERVGQIVEIRYAVRSAGAAGRSGSDADSLVAEILPHPLSLFDRIARDSLEGGRWTSSRPAPGELRAEATAAGATLLLSISTNGRPPSHELCVTGTQGTLHADLFHGFATLEKNRVSRGQKLARPLAMALAQFGAAAQNLGRRALAREFAYPGLRELVRAVYAQIDGSGPPALSPRHALQVARAQRDVLCASEAPPRRPTRS